jgi:hypothetical protein
MMLSVICDDAAALAPAGARRLVFAHHASALQASALQAAQAHAARTLDDLGAPGAAAPPHAGAFLPAHGTALAAVVGIVKPPA